MTRLHLSQKIAARFNAHKSTRADILIPETVGLVGTCVAESFFPFRNQVELEMWLILDGGIIGPGQSIAFLRKSISDQATSPEIRSLLTYACLAAILVLTVIARFLRNSHFLLAYAYIWK